MNRKAILAAALALPLAGLGGLWANTHVMAQQGTEWEVPIRGYDPRDLLRGHYVVYQYEWPGLELGEHMQLRWTPALCIEGTAPTISKTTVATFDYARMFGRPQISCKQQAVMAPEVSQDGVRGLESGILYVSQDRARVIQKQMWDRKLQGVVRIRVRDDGVVTPVDITFRPLPEAAESAQLDRDSQAADAADAAIAEADQP